MTDEPNKSGPGYYGDLLERVLKECDGVGGALVVIKGDRSQSSVLTSPMMSVNIVSALRDLSDGIVRDARIAAKRITLLKSSPPVAAILGMRTLDEIAYESGPPTVQNVNVGLDGGKYGTQLDHLRKRFDFKECVLIVMNGPKGPGFACALAPHHLHKLPETLRVMATGIENDLKDGKFQ